MQKPTVLCCPKCKFSWSTIIKLNDGDGQVFYIICLRCGHIGPAGTSREQAIELWNSLKR